MKEQVFSRTLGPSRSFELFKEGKIIPRFRQNYKVCNNFESGKHTFWFPARIWYDNWNSVTVVLTNNLPNPKWGEGYYFDSDNNDILSNEVICEKEVIPDEIYAIPYWDCQAWRLRGQYGWEFVMWLGSLPLFDGESHIKHFKKIN